MQIQFQPRAGDVLRCDFRGMIAPEMVKLRDVVIVAPHQHNRHLVTLIPLSATAPSKVQPYHYELPTDPRPDGDSLRSIWAKCDMLYTLSTERLSMHYERTRRGGRQSVRVRLTTSDFEAIRRCIAFSLNLSHNEPVPIRGL